jgi:hypothetical protein
VHRASLGRDANRAPHRNDQAGADELGDDDGAFRAVVDLDETAQPDFVEEDVTLPREHGAGW